MGRAVLALTLFTLATGAHADFTNVAWYRLGENDPGAASGLAATNPTAPAVGAWALIPFGGPRYTNATAASAAIQMGSSLALQFNGTSQWLRTNAQISSAVNNFGIEVWVNPAHISPGARVIAFNGNSGLNGWGLYQIGNTYSAVLGGLAIIGAAPATPGTWTHLALVRNNNITGLYVNGTLVASDFQGPNPPEGAFGLACNPISSGFEVFSGAVDGASVHLWAERIHASRSPDQRATGRYAAGQRHRTDECHFERSDS